MILKKNMVFLVSVSAIAQIAMGSLIAVAADSAKLIKVSAKRFEYTPKEIVLKKGMPVVLQLSTEDRAHGFNIPELNVRSDIAPGKVTELKITPQKVGEFNYFCDVFCGGGHESMGGTIKVTD